MWTVHLKYQAILDRLRNKRQANERDLYGLDAAAARRFFSEDLG